MEGFRKLGLSEPFIKIIQEMKFTAPSEIQEKAIPLAMAGKDIIGGSATGSGKTLAFGASIIEKTEQHKGIQTLILTPTRELAEQVAISLAKFSKWKHLHITAVYGGVSIGPQVFALARADIVVGTPGRILDHLERKTINLSKVNTLILDEADRMLDMGFVEDVTDIINRCPKERQTMLFSATISSDIEHLVKKYMKSPEYIAVEQFVDTSKLKQVYYDCQQNEKFSFLVHLLKHEHPGLIMVFCNTQRNTDFVTENLKRYDIDAIAIHGGLSQNKRNNVMEHFRSNRVAVLVCTDVASRGLDIKNVSHVYNYDLPASSKEYTHRIGRTARAGKDGIAISIVSPRDYENFRNILIQGDMKIELLPMPQFEKIFVNFNADSGGRSSGRSYGRGRSSGGFRGRSSEGSRGRSFGGRSEGRRDGRSSGRYNDSPRRRSF